MSPVHEQQQGRAAEGGGQPTCAHEWRIATVTVGADDPRLGTPITTNWKCANEQCGRTRSFTSYSREPIAR